MTVATRWIPPDLRAEVMGDVEARAAEDLAKEKRRVPSLVARTTNLALALNRLEKELSRPEVKASPFVQENQAEIERLVLDTTTAIVGDRARAAEIVRLEREVREKKAGSPGASTGEALGAVWLLLAVPSLLGTSLWAFLSYQETKRAEERTRQLDIHRQVAGIKLKAIQEGAADGVVNALASIEDAVTGKGSTLFLAIGTGAAIALLAVVLRRGKAPVPAA